MLMDDRSIISHQTHDPYPKRYHLQFKRSFNSTVQPTCDQHLHRRSCTPPLPHSGESAFYPTNAVVNLVASSEKVGREASAIIGQSVAAARALEDALCAPVPSRSHLAVVVQTNFQVVAYTRSKLHISTLGLFCDVSTFRRLPNVIFFHLTRDLIRSALRLGVTADQILRFLHVHAHPMLRSGDQPLVPSNVTDQILLWDKEDIVLLWMR